MILKLIYNLPKWLFGFLSLSPVSNEYQCNIKRIKSLTHNRGGGLQKPGKRIKKNSIKGPSDGVLPFSLSLSLFLFLFFSYTSSIFCYLGFTNNTFLAWLITAELANLLPHFKTSLVFATYDKNWKYIFQWNYNIFRHLIIK